MSKESTKYLYQHEQHVLYGWNENTAEQIREGYISDLIVVDERDERIQDLLPKRPVADVKEPRRNGAAKNSKPQLVELPAEVLETGLSEDKKG